MKKLIILLLFLFLNLGCNKKVDTTEIENLKQEETSKIDSITSNTKNTILVEPDTMDTVKVITQKQRYKEKKKKETPISYDRIIEFPGDNAWNGNPMIQQLEMSSSIFNKFPDTLSRLAIDLYKSYEHFFPKAIADNFEEGISTEYVVHPKKLVFQFQVFKNNYQSKPYLIKEITIRRNENKEPYAE